MKLDLNTNTDIETAICQRCDFFVNGDDVTLLVMACDTEEGWAVVADAKRTDRHILKFKPEYGNPYGCRTRLLRGEVEMRPKPGMEAEVERLMALREAGNTEVPNPAPNATEFRQLYLSLHTQAPFPPGGQTWHETLYTGYQRVPLPVGIGDWELRDQDAVNVVAITFPQCEGNGCVITHFGIGPAPSGEGELVDAGRLTVPLDLKERITPEFTAGHFSVAGIYPVVDCGFHPPQQDESFRGLQHSR